ncbi:lytic polysaccharide monooxygenase auxiliary activity family 9 protein [Aspergillus lucknowensis]|uniref:lytic cellulose monooxygenase (C4-dehydrogenating) n=1 Tax=Aspergillus lucknowensis TaxID=176173 RepID=A0ABR4LJV1_9EURO
MKSSLVLASTSLAVTASAHYVFPALIAGGTTTGDWEYVRQWTGYLSNGPVTDVTSIDIRCNVDGSTASVETLDVTAGDTIGMTAAPSIYHPGPVMVYLAQAPGKAAEFDGDGEVWFKIYQDKPEVGSGGLTWPSNGASTVEFTLPASLPDGEYLVRVEQIGLHVAYEEGGSQSYISCGQINVSGGGSGSPSPLVAFPGAYSPDDPGLLISLYDPIPTSYTYPGPEVWSG